MAAVFGLSIALAAPAFADSPHFTRGPTASTSTSGNTVYLNLSFTAAGLGNATAYAEWSLTGTATLDSRCYNNGGNKPQADNKQESIDLDADFQTAVNHGNTKFSGTVATLTSTLTCPGNQQVKVESFSATATLSLVGSSLSADVSWS
jgi:hypothetical protein